MPTVPEREAETRLDPEERSHITSWLDGKRVSFNPPPLSRKVPAMKKKFQKKTGGGKAKGKRNAAHCAEFKC